MFVYFNYCANVFSDLKVQSSISLFLNIFSFESPFQVEQFVITSPHDNKSWEAMDEMIGNAEEFCQVTFKYQSYCYQYSA